MQSKTKPKTTRPKEDDKEQSARFIATARELEVDESGKEFQKAFAKIVPVNSLDRKGA
jgi:hypothetical protein